MIDFDVILNNSIFILVNVVFAIMVSPFWMTLIKKVKAYTQRRKGPPLLQGYYNIIKLFKKEVLYSRVSSDIMHITPYINLCAMIIATISVPLFFIPMGHLGGIGNVILFIYILTLAKFFMALGGLDAGSTFGGMGTSREMSLSAIFEPVIIVVFAALAVVTGSFDIHEIFYLSLTNGVPVVLLPLSLSLFIILIAETGRIPIDNPETHLELTMIHEAMILEQSGRNLALMELSHGIKQTLLMAVLINIFIPVGMTTSLEPLALVVAMIAFFAKGTLLAIIIGVVESSVAKLRLFRIPGYIILVYFFSLITISLTILT